MCRIRLSCDAGQQQQAAALSQPHNHKGKQPISPRTVLLVVMFDALSAQNHIFLMAFSTRDGFIGRLPNCKSNSMCLFLSFFLGIQLKILYLQKS